MNHTGITISVAEDLDTGKFRLMATNYGMTAVAGVRLFRAEPWPSVKFEHDAMPEAERDAAALQAYLDQSMKKRMSRERIRKSGE